MEISLSILVPVYNVSKYIDRCLESIVKQEYEHIQVVVIDDGSNDDSFDICQRFAREYPYVSVFTREHKGIAKTREELLAKACGDFILFVDSDDWIESNMVVDMIQLVAEHGADIAMCGMIYDDRPLYPMNLRAKSGVCLFTGNETLHSFLNNGRLMNSLCNKIIKRTLCSDLRYREELPAGEDLYMMWQLLPKVNRAVCTPALYYHYENNMVSLTRQSAIFNVKTAFHIWRELENEAIVTDSHYYSKVRSAVYFEATSYVYALLKHNKDNDISARSIIEELIPELKKRLPYLRITCRLQLMKAMWGFSGVIGGYPLMNIIYKLYNRLF